MNGKFVYCLACNGWFEHATLPVWGEVHQISIHLVNDRGEVEGADNELCYFEDGFTFSAPPEVDVNWHLHIVEPEGWEPEDDEFIPSGDFWMTPNQLVGL
jgi:hypothetical protein